MKFLLGSYRNQMYLLGPQIHFLKLNFADKWVKLVAVDIYLDIILSPLIFKLHKNFAN